MSLMPSPRALLLLLGLLPGLLLPAGFTFARCGCTEALQIVRSGALPACCAEAPASVEATSCHCCAPSDGSPGETWSDRDGGGCTCEAAFVPVGQPKQVPPTAPHLPPLMVAAAAPWQGMPPPAAIARVVWPPSRPPPEPGSRRNLPLLL
jgi:hypothetical protein